MNDNEAGDKKKEDLSDLDAKIKKAKIESNTSESNHDQSAKNMSEGMRIAMEFTVTIGVSIFIGYSLDKNLGTAPIFIFLLLLLGFMAGVWNMYRVQNNYGRAGIPHVEESKEEKPEE
jgi:F0F1-type ATP synthase assembly protein I